MLYYAIFSKITDTKNGSLKRKSEKRDGFFGHF